MQFMFYMHTCVRESRSCFVIRVGDEEHGCDFGCSGSPQLGPGKLEHICCRAREVMGN